MKWSIRRNMFLNFMNKKVAPTELSFYCMPSFNHKSAPLELGTRTQCRRHELLVKEQNKIEIKSRRDDPLVTKDEKAVKKSRRDEHFLYKQDVKVAPTELSSCCIPLFNHKYAPLELSTRIQCRRHELLVKEQNKIEIKSRRDDLLLHIQDEKVAPTELSSCCIPLFNHKFAPLELLKSRRDDHMVTTHNSIPHKSRRDALLLHFEDKSPLLQSLVFTVCPHSTISPLLRSFKSPRGTLFW